MLPNKFHPPLFNCRNSKTELKKKTITSKIQLLTIAFCLIIFKRSLSLVLTPPNSSVPVNHPEAKKITKPANTMIPKLTNSKISTSLKIMFFPIYVR